MIARAWWYRTETSTSSNVIWCRTSIWMPFRVLIAASACSAVVYRTILNLEGNKKGKKKKKKNLSCHYFTIQRTQRLCLGHYPKAYRFYYDQQGHCFPTFGGGIWLARATRARWRWATRSVESVYQCPGLGCLTWSLGCMSRNKYRLRLMFASKPTNLIAPPREGWCHVTGTCPLSVSVRINSCVGIDIAILFSNKVSRVSIIIKVVRIRRWSEFFAIMIHSIRLDSIWFDIVQFFWYICRIAPFVPILIWRRSACRAWVGFEECVARQIRFFIPAAPGCSPRPRQRESVVQVEDQGEEGRLGGDYRQVLDDCGGLEVGGCWFVWRGLASALGIPGGDYNSDRVPFMRVYFKTFLRTRRDQWACKMVLQI